MMDNIINYRQQQQQLQQILNEANDNTQYIDQDIGHLLIDTSGTYQQIFINQNDGNRLSYQSKQSQKSKTKSQTDSQKLYIPDRKYSLSKSNDSQANSAEINQIDDINHQQFKLLSNNLQNHINNNYQVQTHYPKTFNKFQQYYQKYKSPYTLAQVKQKYPFFVISQPNYNLQEVYQQNIFLYNTLKNVNISTMDVGYCTIANNYRIAMGTTDGRIAIFDKAYEKPVNIFEAFPLKKSVPQKANKKNPIIITSIKWSKNLQYLAVSTNNKQLKVYQFKKSIFIQNQFILKMAKQPVEIFGLTAKELKNSIHYINFVSQTPFMAFLIDEVDDMQVLQYKKHILNDRPFLTKLPLKFNNVFQVQVIDFVVNHDKDYQKRKNNKKKKFQNNTKQHQNQKLSTNNTSQQQQSGILMAVGSDQYVTIALLKPYFEVIMVYDKDKHGNYIKKQGYSHISFRQQPLGLLIIWDKFAQILDIQIQSINPLVTKIRNFGTHLMPETTLAAGLLTDTLIYQLSQSGIKIYATSNFEDEKKFSQYKQYIYQYTFHFYQLPQGYKIQQQLSNSFPSLEVLRLLHSFIKHCNGWLFITFNTSLFSVRIQKYQDFIRNTIQNVNNWKIGLQLLHDGYLGRYKNYDNMTQQVIVKNIHDYSTKYINFLQMVLDNNFTTDKLQTNRNLLWYQQITFLFNILIQTKQFQHLFTNIFQKLINCKLTQFIKCIQPFIMLHRITKITQNCLQLLYQYLSNKQIISILLIANLQPDINQIDLPHMINQIMLQHRMYQQILYINMEFHDYFTPFAIMVSQYNMINNQNIQIKQKQINDIQILTHIAFNKNDSNTQKSIQNTPNNLQQTKTIKKLLNENEQDKTKLKQLISYETYKIIKKINNNQDIPLNANNIQRKIIINKYKLFFQTFLPFFQSSIIHCLLGQQSFQIQLFQFIIPQMFKGQCLEIINDISNRILHTDLMTDFCSNIPISQVKNQRLYWICMIGLYNKSIIKIDVFMGLQYLIKYGQQQFKYLYQSKNSKQNTQQNSQTSVPKQNLYRKQALQQVQTCIKQTIKTSNKKLHEQFQKLSHESLQIFYKQLLSSQQALQQSNIGLLKIVSMILGSGYYINVIHALMSQINIYQHQHQQLINFQQNNTYKNNSHKQSNNIFDFIQQCIHLFKKNQKQQLKNVICQNISYFIYLDCNRLCNIIINNYLLQIDKFVSYNNTLIQKKQNINENSQTFTELDNNNNNNNKQSIEINNYQFIKLVQGILIRLQSQIIQQKKLDKFQSHSLFMINLRLKLLALLAVTGRQHEILMEIKKQNYPLDSTLQICQKYDIIDAEAYLLVKSGGQGEIASAIKLYFQLISKKIKFVTLQTLSQFKDYFISIISQCIKVCESLHTSPDHFNQEWFEICKQIKQLKININKILSKTLHDKLYQIIKIQIYPILSQKIVVNQYTEGIIKYLQQNIQKLQIIFLQQLFNKLLKKQIFEKSILTLSKQIFIQTQNIQRKQIVNKNYIGFKSFGICNYCKQKNGLLIHYNTCGHQIHPSCGQDLKLCIICTFINQNVIQKQLDGLKKIKNQLYVGKNQFISNQSHKEQIIKESLMEKFRGFDQCIGQFW